MLTPGRSLAVDHAYIPLGAPIWLDADEQFLPNKSVHRLLVAQDTGGAIKGPVRGDLFWGAGGAAGDRAGEIGRPRRLLPVAAVRSRQSPYRRRGSPLTSGSFCGSNSRPARRARMNVRVDERLNGLFGDQVD